MIKHKDPKRAKIIAMVICLDKYVRNKLKDDEKERVTKNIELFEDQFIGKLVKK
jgi:hypothetical protein